MGVASASTVVSSVGFLDVAFVQSDSTHCATQEDGSSGEKTTGSYPTLGSDFIPLCTSREELETFNREDSSSVSLAARSPCTLEAAVVNSNESGMDLSGTQCSADDGDDDSDYDSDFASNKVYMEHRRRRATTVTRNKPKMSKSAKVGGKRNAVKMCQRLMFRRMKQQRNRKKRRNRKCHTKILQNRANRRWDHNLINEQNVMVIVD